MVNVALMDKIIAVSAGERLVTVQAGARIKKVTEALADHGLVLQNYASIDDQQVGGFTQVGAHGTGVTIPPVDETVVGLELVTPTRGLVRLGVTADGRTPDPAAATPHDPDELKLSRLALGTVGVVTEATLQCVPRHRLREHTYTLSRFEAVRGHHARLRRHRHVRYLWIPYVDCVVVVVCDPATPEDEQALEAAGERIRADRSNLAEATAALEAELALSRSGAGRALSDPRSELLGLLACVPGRRVSERDYGLSFAELRDELLKHAPLDTDWVRKVNAAEAAYWRGVSGSERVDWSDRILGFECGGQQWVSEVCFPAGPLEGEVDVRDMLLPLRILRLVEREGLPAPAPMEQRWTASSSSPLSPAFSQRQGDIFTWIGTIMYLSSEEEADRARVTAAFKAYERLCREEVWLASPGCAQHWAKLELAGEPEEARQQAVRIVARKFSGALARLQALQYENDEKGVLQNEHVTLLMDGVNDHLNVS